MKTTPYLTPCAAIALFTVFGCGLEAEDDVKADPAKASIKATAIATSDDNGTITIRIEKDGRTETKVIRLDGDDDPAKAGALIAEAIKEPEKKDADHAAKTMTFLGVALDESAGEAAAKLPIEAGVGLRVTGVTKDSPAAKAGVQENDILVRLDDQILVTPQQLIVLVRNRKPGDTVRLTYFREDGKYEAEAILGETDARELGGGGSDLKQLDYPQEFLRDLTDGAKRKLLRSRLLRVDPEGKVTEEVEEEGGVKKRPFPWPEWQRDSADARKKMADDYSRAQGEMAARMKEEFARLQEESQKLNEQFRSAQSELAEKFGAEMKKAQAAAREAQRAVASALAELREREAAARDAAKKAADKSDKKFEEREEAEKAEKAEDKGAEKLKKE